MPPGPSIARRVLIPLLLLATPAVAQQAVSVETLLSSPFPSDLTAAPSGGAIAWIQAEEGVRNIWVAAPPAYDAMPITRYEADDGQTLGGLEFTADGRTLFYVRGGAPNRQGDIPNPRSDPAGAERAIWRVSLAGGDPVRVGEGSGPTVSPRGDLLAFQHRGQVWSAPVDSSRDPEQLFEVRRGAGSIAWSPDGSRIAFVSSRGSHSFVGVYDRDEETVTWMAPGVDRDGSPVWSPDGTRVAFLRIAASSELMSFRAQREATPWSIVVADAATGEGRAVWTAEPGPGSAFRGVVGPSLLWTAGDRIVFPWERTGWTHLYSIPAGGGEAVHLTPGEGEVEYVALGPDGREVFYNSNHGDIDRRNLWRVPVAGGAPVPITRSNAVEWAPTPTGEAGALAFLRSDARTPAHAVIREGDSEPRQLVPDALAGFPLRAMVEPEQVVYTAADGMPIHAQLFRPANLSRGEQRPAVIFIHGGSRRQMLLGWHYGQYYHHAYALNQYLASRGYLVLSINFRSGTGYGMEFREAIDYGAGGGSELQDLLGAGLYLRSRDDVDPDRIGLWGGSYGGYMTALGLARASDLFAAGVDIHGVHDWNVGIQTFRPDYNPLEDPERTRVAFQASPMAHLDSWRSPVLLIHGDDDRNVRFLETVNLVEELRERDVHVEYLVFPDEVHNFLVHDNWVRAFEATADFFDRKLRGGVGR